MAEYIEREAAIRVASGYCHPANIAAELAKLPAADVRPVVMGKWMLNALESVATCSECECCVPTIWKDPDIYWNFCPNCGAKLVER